MIRSAEIYWIECSNLDCQADAVGLARKQLRGAWQTIRAAEEMAKESGWLIDGSQHYCPDCAAKIYRQRLEVLEATKK